MDDTIILMFTPDQYKDATTLISRHPDLGFIREATERMDHEGGLFTAEIKQFEFCYAYLDVKRVSSRCSLLKRFEELATMQGYDLKGCLNEKQHLYDMSKRTSRE